MVSEGGGVWWRGSPLYRDWREAASAGWEPPGLGARRPGCHPALPSASWGSLAPPRAPPDLGDGVEVGIGNGRVGRGGCGPRGYFLLHSPSSTYPSPRLHFSPPSPVPAVRHWSPSSALLVHFLCRLESGVSASGLRGSGACELSIKGRGLGYLLML